MNGGRHVGLQALVFSLVSSTFLTIYITQPVLPMIRSEFGVSASYASHLSTPASTRGAR